MQLKYMQYTKMQYNNGESKKEQKFLEQGGQQNF